MFGMFHRYVEGNLGWRPEEDRSYLDKYPLTMETIPSIAQPCVLGIPWYSGFDRPKQDGPFPWSRWWMGRGDLGYVRGGHAICVLPGTSKDQWNWWYFYDQGSEGACVGFSLSRAVSLMNRYMYDGRWLYKQAQLIDEWSDTPPGEGTSVRAGCDILVTRGHKRIKGEMTYPEDIGAGISKYRWATSVDDIHNVLKSPDADRLGAIAVLNSWGRAYPRKVWIPDETIDRIVFQEGGECAVLTDR